MKITIIFVITILSIISVFIIYQIYQKNINKSQNSPLSSTASQTSNQSNQDSILNNTKISPYNLTYPIAQFKERITKKPFGIYITGQNSPIQPERFSGYHTGVDVEYSDISNDVPVYAIGDATVIYSNWVSGYGGFLILKTSINGKSHSVAYGHLRPVSLPAVGTNFKKGDQIAVLGTGYSTETDGERKHLHFSILSDDRIDLKGYVQNKSDLSGWIDLMSLYN